MSFDIFQRLTNAIDAVFRSMILRRKNSTFLVFLFLPVLITFTFFVSLFFIFDAVRGTI